MTAIRQFGTVEPATSATFTERHYSVAEIAVLWSLSTDAVRSLFAREHGVMVLGGDASTPTKRRYRTLRIPESVVQRVHQRLTNV